MTELENFRAQKDAFFKSHPQSPLTAEQQAAFAGLCYFPENPDLRLVLPLEEFADKDSVVMPTSTGDARAYTALVPEITPPEDLPSANALTSMSVQMGRIVGPALVGLDLLDGYDGAAHPPRQFRQGQIERLAPPPHPVPE